VIKVAATGGNRAAINQGISTVTIPASVTAIGEYAFAATALDSFTFEDGGNQDLMVIPKCAFAYNKLDALHSS
jgi:hypothetical protein